ncbi:hypothetical protein [Qipengyuania qiaonensis]|uniref:Uncharacterized protein n=1 Tax=Qipengyuania qiaonensis TaxID=2867240 RepID=A0ABS7J8G7_9SPHN|nr:hypothetical protein [Qipengyuania qiaonensis]MBX7482611.1 hypothetical protein [Qipengyuania qiaonensis]
MTFNQRMAAVIFLIFAVGYLLAAEVTGHGRAGETIVALLAWQVIWAVLALIGLAVAVAQIFFRPGDVSGRRAWLDRFLPILALAIAVPLGGWLVGERYRLMQLDFARDYRTELSGAAPSAVTYWEGMPDGGIAIVRSPGRDPATLPQTKMLDLTGERIKSCRALDAQLWSCHFD